MWDAIRNALGWLISFFYDLVPNVGVAIILLTIAVGLLMFPLTLKQTRSMKAMQEIQPELKRLQKDLKHDKQALQEATMALYKEKGVNPAAGCLPLLLQMPVWFALFQVLRQFAVDIYHLRYNLGNIPGVGTRTLEFTVGDPDKFLPAGSKLASAATAGDPLSFLWMDMRVTPAEVFQNGFVKALPYLITIFVVMGTAYWQQRQTMAKSQRDGNEQQPGQAIMKIFPVFFGFISFSLPAGLVVYFAASQIFRIGQQSFILRMDEGKEDGGTPKPKTTSTTPKPVEKPRPATPRQAAQRRPQGSKKKRGKKRRRR
ncbi:MAG: YidC/Oxa1 family membrane protein insertase [Actinobacteria bacterium]|nr:YidC/Oxa1 family membrane protein insertase [Actinomycetota bacterium]